jgi:hypothetical protein
MPEIIRTRETQCRGQDYSSDDERSYGRSSYSGSTRYKSVQRYVVMPKSSVPIEEFDDGSSCKSALLDVGTHVEIDRRVGRVERIEHPRSVLECREPARDREVNRTIVIERGRSLEPRLTRCYERKHDGGYG